ncbi:TRAP transporter small permease [Halomonas sp. McH1-25]|uniref:TRAP transporter small permease n=1 Tax=unclassified Halomonas TaxID=2609666 RepID=UPI001EF74736|nr:MULTISPECIES: TRAP transporter small permease [unclassified Halomonas]MCG7599174.1 TRAP transporter small permease [Halomonas sp. McH1-25]MCP1344317.1 TRAP transporter small permease [Halomonas sp. FL8]MCP1362668.1 TRAP transporter small permease [Halomonas sp. BBD45]MCP1366186.1 TRAP transporter small permease [Halomonas sp. BBD48]
MWRWFDKLEDILAIVLLGCTSLTILASSTTRAIGHPFAGGAELAQFFFIWTAVFGADITLRRGGQVRIDALVMLMSAGVLRAITAVILAMMLAFLAMLVWYGLPLALSNWQRPMGFAGLSYGYVTLALPVGAALMFISLIRRIVDKGIVHSLDPDDDVVEETL